MPGLIEADLLAIEANHAAKPLETQNPEIYELCLEVRRLSRENERLTRQHDIQREVIQNVISWWQKRERVLQNRIRKQDLERQIWLNRM